MTTLFVLMRHLEISVRVKQTQALKESFKKRALNLRMASMTNPIALGSWWSWFQDEVGWSSVTSLEIFLVKIKNRMTANVVTNSITLKMRTYYFRHCKYMLKYIFRLVILYLFTQYLHTLKLIEISFLEWIPMLLDDIPIQFLSRHKEPNARNSQS